MYFERSDNAAWDAGFYGIRVDGNQLVDSTAVADPSTASAGDIYYRTDTKKLRVYDGSSWSDV